MEEKRKIEKMGVTKSTTAGFIPESVTARSHMSLFNDIKADRTVMEKGTVSRVKNELNQIRYTSIHLTSFAQKRQTAGHRSAR